MTWNLKQGYYPKEAKKTDSLSEEDKECENCKFDKSNTESGKMECPSFKDPTRYCDVIKYDFQLVEKEGKNVQKRG